jgi:hypothetical protein
MNIERIVMVSRSYKLIASHVYVRPWSGSRHNDDDEKFVAVLQLAGAAVAHNFLWVIQASGF